MKKLIAITEESVKSFLAEKSNKLFLFTLIGFGILGYFQYQETNKTELLIKKMEDSNMEIKKKIDHRYFNLTRSLEDIFDTQIDTFNGKAAKK